VTDGIYSSGENGKGCLILPDAELLDKVGSFFVNIDLGDEDSEPIPRPIAFMILSDITSSSHVSIIAPKPII